MRLTAKDVAIIGVMTALLIGGQALFAQVQGIEVVSLLLLCFSYVFGVLRGALCAVSFSLLRCFLFGFDVKTVILYLIYYTLFGIIFGILGHSSREKRVSLISVFITELLFVVLFILPVLFLSGHIKISILLLDGLNALCIGILVLGSAGFLLYNSFILVARRREKYYTGAKIVSVVVIAAVCTIAFTLLDDLLYPVFYGAWGQPAIAYFYASFAAMIPQTISNILTVSILFLPLTKIFAKVAKSMLK